MAILLLASSAAAQNQSAASVLKVAVVTIPPVMQQNGSLTGFSVDLWNAVGTRLKLTTDYQVAPDAL